MSAKLHNLYKAGIRHFFVTILVRLFKLKRSFLCVCNDVKNHRHIKITSIKRPPMFSPFSLYLDHFDTIKGPVFKSPKVVFFIKVFLPYCHKCVVVCQTSVSRCKSVILHMFLTQAEWFAVKIFIS